MMSTCVHRWSIVDCEANNCVKTSDDTFLRMRVNRQYDPITVRFKDEPLKEIYVGASTLHDTINYEMLPLLCIAWRLVQWSYPSH